MNRALRKSPTLNQRQKKFVDYYVQSGNATESARKAGYSESNASVIGSNLLINPKIRNAINARLEQLESERIAETKEILEHLTATMRGEVSEEVVVNVGIGKGLTQPVKVVAKVQAKERLKAAELLGKVRGLFVTRQEIDLQGAMPVVTQDDL